jgi:hypothetical protein
MRMKKRTDACLEYIMIEFDYDMGFSINATDTNS